MLFLEILLLGQRIMGDYVYMMIRVEEKVFFSMMTMCVVFDDEFSFVAMCQRWTRRSRASNTPANGQT